MCNFIGEHVFRSGEIRTAKEFCDIALALCTRVADAERTAYEQKVSGHQPRARDLISMTQPRMIDPRGLHADHCASGLTLHSGEGGAAVFAD